MPTPSKAVHFDKPKAVLDAYRKQDIPAFALFCSKQLVSKYQGDDIADGEQALAFWVKNLMQDERAAIYTVCLYEEVPPKGIKDNTPYDGSFNFRFFKYPAGYLPEDISRTVGGGMDKLFEKLESMQEEIKELRELKDQPVVELKPPPDNSVGAVILRQVEPMIPLLMNRLVEWIPMPGDKKKASHLSGVLGAPATRDPEERIKIAIETLKDATEDLPALLEKLALLSIKNPIAFKGYMTLFANMNI